MAEPLDDLLAACEALFADAELIDEAGGGMYGVLISPAGLDDLRPRDRVSVTFFDDANGHHIASHVEDVSEEDMGRRAAEAMGT